MKMMQDSPEFKLALKLKAEICLLVLRYILPFGYAYDASPFRRRSKAFASYASIVVYLISGPFYEISRKNETAIAICNVLKSSSSKAGDSGSGISKLETGHFPVK